MRLASTRYLTIGIALIGLVAASPAWGTSAMRTSSFAYDPGTGLLTQEVVDPGTPSLRLETDYTYDAFGNKVKTRVSGVDIATRSTATTYDSQGQFPVSATNALSQSESWQYASRFGTPTSHTGPNGLTTTWAYDSFGRKILETRADGTQTKYAYLYCSGINGGTASCPAGAAYLVQTTPVAADGATQNGPQTTSYYDTLNRVIEADSQGFDGTLIRATTQYDSFGRVAQASRPFFAGGTPVYTSYSYDALSRVSTETYPDQSTTSYAYHGLTIAVTRSFLRGGNQVSETRTTVKNDQGKVASVTDPAGGVTSYAYDPFDDVVQITDPVGNVTTYSYDTRGRKVAMNDPDMGALSYAYNTLSELVSRTDAKGQTSTFQYDLLGRMTQRVEPDMTAGWAYDTAPMGIGKLASASITAGPSSGYQRSYSYDSLGRPAQLQFTFANNTYTVATTYDAASRLSTATYPSGLEVQYSYTSLGYLQQLQQLVNGQPGQVYWTAQARDAELHLLTQQAGNGVTTQQGFDPDTGLLTSFHAVTPNEGEVENLAFTYDAVGDLTQRQDLDQNLSESFVYDGLNRLTQSTITGSPANPPVKSFAYDAIGNITAKPETGSYTYPPPGSPQPHAVLSISGGSIALATSFTYDANGNETSGMGGRTIGYTSFNKPNSIAEGTVNVSFIHDPEHQRLDKTDSNGGSTTTTLYLRAGPVYAELVTSGGGVTAVWNDYLIADGQMVGVRFDNISSPLSPVVTTRYFSTDHLGSITALTDENANVVQRLSYDPWGRQRDPSAWADDVTGSLPSQDQTTRGFTGQEQLVDVGLVHLNGRVYDPLLGRFTSADSVVQDPFNAQSLNRYAYVYNNPLSYSDPSGHCFLGCFWKPIFKSPVFKAVVAVAIVATAQYELTPTLTAVYGGGTLASIEASAAVGFVAGAAASGVTGGNVLRGAIVGGLTAGAFNGAGDISNFAANVAAHAAIGCVSAAADGGDCGSGAAAAGLGAFAAPEITSAFQHPQQDFGDLVGGTVASATVGGVGSILGGGKFENGAVTSAFGYLFNAALHTPEQQAAAQKLFVPYMSALGQAAFFLFGGEILEGAELAYDSLVGGEAAESVGPELIGSFEVPGNLTFGTTTFGNYAHVETANLLQSLYPDANFAFRVLPGQTSVDVTVLGQDSIDAVRFEFGEIKPLTASGEATFNRQILNWGLPGPVQPITYDAAGNVYLGFH